VSWIRSGIVFGYDPAYASGSLLPKMISSGENHRQREAKLYPLEIICIEGEGYASA
jgi:hypothetical protein